MLKSLLPFRRRPAFLRVSSFLFLLGVTTAALSQASTASARSQSSDTLAPQTAFPRPMRPADLYRLPAISDPQASPDGKWVSYTVTTIDSLKDSRNSDI